MGRVDTATLLYFDASCLIAAAYPGINRKDEHVVAAALEVRADFLLTLDQPLAEEIERCAVDIQVRSPGAFIRLDLVTHPLFDLLRDG